MSSTIDHVGIHAPKDQFESIIDWYKKALAPLNYREIMRFPGAVGLGSEHPDFWISEADEQCGGFHFAFIAHGRFPLVPGGPTADDQTMLRLTLFTRLL